MSITHTTGFTREYSVITCKHKSAQQELLASIFNSSAIAREQCTSQCRKSPTRELSSNFLEAQIITHKLGRELYSNI